MVSFNKIEAAPAGVPLDENLLLMHLRRMDTSFLFQIRVSL